MATFKDSVGFVSADGATTVIPKARKLRSMFAHELLMAFIISSHQMVSDSVTPKNGIKTSAVLTKRSMEL